MLHTVSLSTDELFGFSKNMVPELLVQKQDANWTLVTCAGAVLFIMGYVLWHRQELIMRQWPPQLFTIDSNQ